MGRYSKEIQILRTYVYVIKILKEMFESVKKMTGVL